MNLWLEKLSSKILRPVMRQFTSSKRISQRGFEKLTDEMARSGYSRRISFAKSDSLPNILKFDSETLSGRVLVLGGSDFDISLEQYKNLDHYKSTMFYIQNLDFPETENVRVLPIGVEDMEWGKNGMPWNFLGRYTSRKKKDKILVGPFAKTNSIREECLSGAMVSVNCEIYQNRMPNWVYSRLSSEFRFVACPRGNGLDTHRFWETLYRGSIPVVLESKWAMNLISYGIPVVTISDWRQLYDVSSERLKLDFVHQNPFLDPGWWSQRWLADLEKLA